MPTRLFSPLTLRSVTIRNRLWVAPMCQYAVDREDGVPTDWHLVHLGSLARGGAGLVMTEATAITAVGRISAEDTGIYTDEQQSAWQRIVSFIHSQGAVAGIQLSHAGRKGSTWREWGDNNGTRPIGEGGWTTLAPSPIAFGSYDAPTALTAEEIAGVVSDFAAAAKRSVAAGFAVLEVHAAHGYLLHQFLSPLSNHRSDQFGGTLKNRARLLLDVVSAVRCAVGESVPIFVRFSATDWAENGFSPEDTATIAAWARDAGADLFDISTGGLVAGTEIPIGPGYQVPFAEFVKTSAEVPVSAVGLITAPQQAAEILDSGKADAVMMARELLRDPNFPMRAARELGVTVDYWPRQYHRGGWTD